MIANTLVIRIHRQVCKLSNVYKKLGVKKGDRVVLYIPMIPEAAYAMLACARIGAIHSIVFAGFSPEALASRIEDCGASLLVTADEAPRGGKITPLKTNVDKALNICGDIKTLVVERTNGDVSMKNDRDYSYSALLADASEDYTRGDEWRIPFYFIHFWFNRKTQRRFAYVRLSSLGIVNTRVCF